MQFITKIPGHTQSNNFNFFPIHVYLSVGSKTNIMKILLKSIFQNF